MKREDRYGKLTPSQPVDGTSWVVPKPKNGKPHYHTNIYIGAERINLYSYSDAEKKKAVKLWKAVQDANPTSLTSQRKRMAEREAKHVAKRTKDVETHGDDSKIERDVLNANREALTKDGVLVFLDGVYGSTDYYVHYEFTKSRGAIHFHSILFSLHEAYVRENID